MWITWHSPSVLLTSAFFQLKLASFAISRHFWNCQEIFQNYDLIIFDHEVINKILSGDANYTADIVVWPKFDNSIITSIYYNLNFTRIWKEKPLLLRGGVGSSSMIWVWHKVWPWNFTHKTEGNLSNCDFNKVLYLLKCKVFGEALCYRETKINFQ